MHPSQHARIMPDKPAIILAGTGEVVTYLELDRSSSQIARCFREAGLRRGDVIAIWLRNSPNYLIVAWAAERSGLRFVPIPTHLTNVEASYILNDAEAALLVTSGDVVDATRLAELSAACLGLGTILTVRRGIDGIPSLDDMAAAQPANPIEDESRGIHMPYSSGTTGRPKGVRLPLPDGPITAEAHEETMRYARYNVAASDIYLTPAPLYHTAPLVYSMAGHRVGETVVLLERFAPEKWLDAVARYHVTWSQVVPTMFVRLLKLPEAVRSRYDLSSLRCLVHAAAPCPIAIKRQMIDWVGPILYEYYGSSEGAGSTFIGPEEWLAKPGSVGRANWGVIHICSDDGSELLPGQAGNIFFEGDFTFRYHNDDDKTSSTRHPSHPNWVAVGDIGYLDTDGYLFLTDRAAFMIVSGGVNIYPQEIENLLVTHPQVLDAAVIGVPSADFGEEVKAVVQPVDDAQDKDRLSAELLEFCRAHLSPVKCPKTIDIVSSLPRGENGKLYKKLLRDQFWHGATLVS